MLPCVTWKLSLTRAAAAQALLPACVAWMVQVPVATSVSVAPVAPDKAHARELQRMAAHLEYPSRLWLRSLRCPGRYVLRSVCAPFAP